MKIELKKKQEAITGDIWYYVTTKDGDGTISVISSSWTPDMATAETKFAEICEKAKQFPEDKFEVLKSVEI